MRQEVANARLIGTFVCLGAVGDHADGHATMITVNSVYKER
ncbi:hypothetical protein LMG9964_06222 [Paraburkholderia phenoliruptrix]|uniref:Uncharacterized protein n=1 Tax=Paraburkholderia phenoliruptrix TaxID=252970 RepID=A0A6J5KGZ4_9BURK|nr:hypothetical protein LMG9964_06222 [Paraburkholderia phenoliruptrix]